jgi:hypothetical protein
MNQSTTRYSEDDNSMSSSRSSDIERGPAFSPSMPSQNNYSFEFLNHEIGMWRPVCSISLIKNKEFYLLSLKMVYAKFTF